MPSVFGYWTIRGLGQAVRFLLEYVGEDYEDERWDATKDQDKWKAAKEANPHKLDFPNLPYYVDGEVRLTQHSAILRYLARKHGLAAATEEERRQTDMLEGAAFDLRLALAFLCYGTEESFNAHRQGTVERGLPFCRQLSAFLGDKQWFTGDKIRYVDFLLYDVLTNWVDFERPVVEQFENLRRFRKRFEDLPAIQRYMKTDKFVKWPMNLPLAFWGGK